MSVAEIQNVTKKYQMGEHAIFALESVSLSLDGGQLVCVLGPSGSGKTTLLNLLGGIDDVTTGSILISGVDITKLSRKKLAGFRRSNVGFIFQFFNLLPIYNAFENVEYAVELSLSRDKKMTREQVRAKVLHYLKTVGLEHKQHYFPSQLSGGEQQKVAVARAMAKEPKLLLADEPTGELSVNEGKMVLKVIQQLSRQSDVLVVLVTHNQEISKVGNTVIRLRSGEVDNIIEQTPVEAETLEW
ncbi:MAG: ABC transporter ATP-binding protein [Candidatus Hermodarchaeota archaeon]